MKSEQILKDLWENIKQTSTPIMGVLKGEEEEKGVESLFKEIIAQNFPNLTKDMDIQIQETQ